MEWLFDDWDCLFSRSSSSYPLATILIIWRHLPDLVQRFACFCCWGSGEATWWNLRSRLRTADCVVGMVRGALWSMVIGCCHQGLAQSLFSKLFAFLRWWNFSEEGHLSAVFLVPLCWLVIVDRRVIAKVYLSIDLLLSWSGFHFAQKTILQA